jgi:hypothetical protein
MTHRRLAGPEVTKKYFQLDRLKQRRQIKLSPVHLLVLLTYTIGQRLAARVGSLAACNSRAHSAYIKPLVLSGPLTLVGRVKVGGRAFGKRVLGPPRPNPPPQGGREESRLYHRRLVSVPMAVVALQWRTIVWQACEQADSIWTASAGHAIAPTCLYRRLQSDRLGPWRKAIMKFVASILVVFAVVGAAGAIHPPMGPTPGSSSSGGTTTTVSITSTTPSVVPTPEPSTVALALIGFVGGGTYRLLRRRCRPTKAPAPVIPSC